MKTWNSHRIRKSKDDNQPSGKPVVLYFLPHLSRAEDRLVKVDSLYIDACEDQCSRKTDKSCDDIVHDLCTQIMTELNLEFPPDNSDLADLYLALRFHIKSLL